MNIQAHDVTAASVDLDARIKALEVSVNRLSEIMAESGSMTDLLAVESELSRRQAELDSLRAQKAALDEAVALSTVTIYLSEEQAPTVVQTEGFLGGLQAGWATFLSILAVAVTAVGFALPFLAVLVIVALVILVILQRIARRHRSRKETSSQSAI